MKRIAMGLAVVAALVAAVLLVARMSDGPLGIIAGGPLEAGEMRTARGVDWSFAREVGEIELQLVEPPRSRTVWVVVDEGALYVPCGFLDLPVWKQWPHEARKDGRAIVRIEGVRYEVQLVRADDPAIRQRVAERVAQKYDLGVQEGAVPDPETTWFFRLDPRA